MKKCAQFIGGSLVAGILVVAPVYLGGLLLLKIMSSLAGLVKPFARLLPEWLPAEHLLSLLLVLLVCFLIGVATRTAPGRALGARLERSLLAKIPGYTLFRSLTQRLAGKSVDETWRPALAEIEEALVPAFIIEQFTDGRYTVFVPSVPTPLAGAVYILTPDRVHPLDIPFTQAMKTVSRWGSGSQELVAAMDRSGHGRHGDGAAADQRKSAT